MVGESGPLSLNESKAPRLCSYLTCYKRRTKRITNELDLGPHGRPEVQSFRVYSRRANYTLDFVIKLIVFF